MVLFGSLLDQSVSSFDRANVLSTFEFDAVRFIDFSTRNLIYGFNGLGTFIFSSFFKNLRSRFILESMIIVSLSNFEMLWSIASLIQ